MSTTTCTSVPDRQWYIVRRWQEFAGEGRTNLLRVVAIAGYYAVHLFTYLSVAERSPADRAFHRLATYIAAGWLFLTLAVLIALQRRYLPSLLKYATTLLDLVLLTALAQIGTGPQSPLIAGYFVVIAAAALRLSLPLVWFTTFGSLIGYLSLVGARDPVWFDAEHVTSPAEQLATLWSLALTGMVIGQVVRRVRLLAEEYHHGVRSLPTTEPNA